MTAGRPAPRGMAVVVIGMHRSGTSAVAGALARLGLALPHDLMPAQADNPRGFHEATGITDLNDRILAAAGGAWDQPPALPPNLVGHWLPDAAAAIASSFAGLPAIVLKDPRISLLRPLWDAALRRQGFRPRHILVHRNPLDVATSLAARNGIDRPHAFRLWLAYILSALEAERSGQLHAVIDYDALIASPAETLARTAAALELTTQAEAVAGIHADDRHHHAGTSGSPDLPPAVAACEGLLRRWSSLPRDERLAALDRMAPERQALWRRNSAAADPSLPGGAVPSASLPVAPTGGRSSMGRNWDGVWVRRARDMGEHARQVEQDRPLLDARIRFAQRLVEAHDPIRLPAICVACGSVQPLAVRVRRTGPAAPQANWRESASCTCGLNSRARAALHALMAEGGAGPGSVVYATEQVTALYRRLSALFPRAIGSEYLAEGTAEGAVNASGVRHEDLTRLTFPTATLDAVISLDVLEHVPDYRTALSEMRRVLRPGGHAVMTFPFRIDLAETLVRARIADDGTVVHVEQPEYHGDPVRPEGGALCYYHFGWSVLADMRAAGFGDAYLLSLQSTDFGYLGPRHPIIVGRA